MRRRALPWILALVVAGVSTGCTKTRARTEPEMPALAMPPPPPRLIAPVESEPLPTVAQPEEAPARQRPRPSTRPQTRAERPTDPKGEPGIKPDAAVEAPHDDAPAADSPQLKPVQSGDDVTVERRIREVLTQASGDLNRVDYGALGSDTQAQYDTAKRFIQQAYEALKTKNFVFAANLADKAATLAAVLLGR
jgi:hypothetical protein